MKAPFCPICKTNTFHMGPHPSPDARDEALRQAAEALRKAKDPAGCIDQQVEDEIDAAIAAIEALEPCPHCGSKMNHPPEARDVCPTYERYASEVQA